MPNEHKTRVIKYYKTVQDINNNLFDLLVENEAVAYKSVGRRKITYEVVRTGY